MGRVREARRLTFALFTVQDAVHEGGDAALSYDPRYFRCRCSGFRRRSWNALEMSFLAFDKNGHKRIDFPQLIGAYGSGMLVTTWYPRRYSPFVQGVQMGHQQMASCSGSTWFASIVPN